MNPAATSQAGILAAALRYHALGLKLVEVGYRSKKAIQSEWQKYPLATEADIRKAFGNGVLRNVGIALGGQEGFVDGDADCSEAAELAEQLAPATGFVYGRAGRPGAHRVYRCQPPCASFQWKDPVTGTVDLELRGSNNDKTTYRQSVAPPSVWRDDPDDPDREESIEFVPCASLAIPVVDRDELYAAYVDIYIATLLSRYPAEKGSRHFSFLALAAWWARAGVPVERSLRILQTVSQRVRPESHDRAALEREVRDSYNKVFKGAEATGYPTLLKLLPHANVVLPAVADALGLKPAGAKATVPPPGWGAGEYPEPQPILGSLPPVERFDLDLLPEIFRGFVEDVAERMQVLIEMVAIFLVVVLAGAVGRRVRIYPKAVDDTWIVIANLWGAIVMPPGFLKSPVLRLALKALAAIERRWHDEDKVKKLERTKEEARHNVKQTAWKEQAKQASKKGTPLPTEPDDLPLPDPERRLIVNDATPEALHQILADNPAGVLYLRDELTGWFVDLDRPGREQARAFFLEGWNGDGEFTVDRIGRGSIRTDACCLSVLGGIVPARLRSYLADVFEDNAKNDGLIQRLQLLIWPDLPPSWTLVDRLPNMEAFRKVQTVFDRLTELEADMPCCLKFSEDAQELFDYWLSNLELQLRSDQEHPALISHLSKYRSMMPSLAGLFCLIRLAATAKGVIWFFEKQPQLISLEDAKQAAALCAYLESHARRMYSCIVSPGVRAAHELATKMKAGKLGSDTFRVRDVYLKGWSALDTPERARQALAILEDADWIRATPASTVGRPPEEYRINPRVF